MSTLSEIAPQCSAENLEKLVHSVVDAICAGKYPRVLDFEKMVSPAHWRVLVSSLTSIVKEFGRLQTCDIGALLQAAGFTAEQSKVMSSAASARKPELRKALLLQTSKIASASITDFDWKVSVAFASDSMATLNETLLMLTFKVGQAGPNTAQEEIKMELSRPELTNLISKLEAANKIVTELSV
eukprot:m.100459 g.100459  ORF g.100459 m.100459 type:complete len:184 (-) comp27245_c3_seq1:72-623(-)